MTGLSFRAIVELVNSNNENGLRSFLDTHHANVDDKDEVRIRSSSALFRYCFTQIVECYINKATS